MLTIKTSAAVPLMLSFGVLVDDELNPVGCCGEWELKWLHAGHFATHKPVFVLGFYSTVTLFSQGHETPAPPGVSSCMCEELLGSA